MVVTDISTAELIKHAANAFLSTKISFINMVSDLCEKVGADVTAVTRGIGLDSRIGPQFLDAGIGYGGYCFPKDLRAFIYLAEEHGVDFSLLQEVERINQRRVDIFIRKVHQALWTLRGKTLGILGLAFKAGTDDIREAVSLKIIQALLDEGSILRLYDPQAMPNTQRVFPAIDGATHLLLIRLRGGAAARKPCCCSPSGKNSASWTSRVCATSWKCRFWWMAETSLTLTPCAKPASNTFRMGRDGAGPVGHRAVTGKLIA